MVFIVSLYVYILCIIYLTFHKYKGFQSVSHPSLHPVFFVIVPPSLFNGPFAGRFPGIKVYLEPNIFGEMFTCNNFHLEQYPLEQCSLRTRGTSNKVYFEQLSISKAYFAIKLTEKFRLRATSSWFKKFKYVICSTNELQKQTLAIFSGVFI